MTLAPTGATRLVANEPTAASLAGMQMKTTATEHSVYLLACENTPEGGEPCAFQAEGYIDGAHFVAFEPAPAV
jgi:hypothetical protein